MKADCEVSETSAPTPIKCACNMCVCLCIYACLHMSIRCTCVFCECRSASLNDMGATLTGTVRWSHIMRDAAVRCDGAYAHSFRISTTHS
jgi:hypothetical protein